MRSTFRKLAFALGIYLAVWIGTCLFFLVTFRLGPEENEVADRLDFTFTNIFPHLIDAWTFGNSAGAILVWFFSLILFWPCLAIIWTLWSFRSSNLKAFTLRAIFLRQLVPLWLISALGFGGFCLYFKVGSVQDFGLHLNAAMDSPVVWRDLVVGRIKLGDSGEKLRENYDLNRVEIVEGADLYESPRNGWFSGLYLMTSDDKIVWAGTGDETWDISFFEYKVEVDAIDQKFSDRYQMAKSQVESLTQTVEADPRFSLIQLNNSRKAGDIRVSGYIASEKNFEDLQHLIVQSNPPFGVDWKVEIDLDTFQANLAALQAKESAKKNVRIVSELLSDYDIYVFPSEETPGAVAISTIITGENELAEMKEMLASKNLSFQVTWETSVEANALIEYRKKIAERFE